MRRPRFRARLAVAVTLILAGCDAYTPLAAAPPSPDRPWLGAGLQRISADLAAERFALDPKPVTIDAQKTYELADLIDVAERTNPETRIAWERAQQAAIAVGLAEGLYFPKLATAATGAIASTPLPIPKTVVPAGVFRADTEFIIPNLSLEWLLLDFGRRRAAVDAAKALTVEANAAFNAKHEQIAFDVTRDFYALTAARAKVNASRAALDAARTLEEAVTSRKGRGLATQPELLQAQEAAARAVYDVEDANAAEHDARMALVESVGIHPGTQIEIADVSQRPLPPDLEESIDEAIDRAMKQRPDLIALLAGVRAKEAAVSKARADFWPKLAVRSAVGGNIGRLSVENSPYQSVHELLYDAGLRLELDLFDGFERRNNLDLAVSGRKEAENELDHAKQKAVREVWKAYDDSKVALTKQRAAAALLTAADRSAVASMESYKNGLSTFPDVREAERNLARARTLEQSARAEAWTRAAAFAVSTGDLAQP
jgi:outer membrane protein TolC